MDYEISVFLYWNSIQTESKDVEMVSSFTPRHLLPKARSPLLPSLPFGNESDEKDIGCWDYG